jgi:hypothetical protein
LIWALRTRFSAARYSFLSLTGGKTLRHDPAFIKEMIDMRMTGHEKPVPGTLGMDHQRHAPPKGESQGDEDDKHHDSAPRKIKPTAGGKKTVKKK